MVIHFDGKLLEDNSGESGERLAVIASGDTPECHQGKLISARKIPGGSGLEIATEVAKSTREWNLTEKVIGMCFDTTSSNTGWLNGAAVNLELKLKRPLLWLPCRKHISELFLKGAWYAIFDEDMGPNYGGFKEFKEIWTNINKENFKGIQPKSWMKDKRDFIIQICSNALAKGHSRDDYKENIELVLVVLGVMPAKFSFKKPGAIHKARWMAPMIYGLKMFLFRNELKKSAIPIDQKKFERFVSFVCFVYIEHWINVSNASDAPFMDLKMYKTLLSYHSIDKPVASAVLKKLKLHTWYLNQEFAPLSLFSDKVSNEEKKSLAKTLLQIKPSKYEMGCPNPVSLPESPKEGLKLKLSEFCGRGSLFIFDQLSFDKNWLKLPIDQWKNNEPYNEMKRFIECLLVTNDTAERGVKLVSDFANSITKDPQDREYLLQIVEQHRRLFPDQNKSTLSKGLQQLS